MSDNRLFRVVQSTQDEFVLVIPATGEPVADLRIPYGADIMDVSGLIADVSEAYRKLFNQQRRN